MHMGHGVPCHKSPDFSGIQMLEIEDSNIVSVAAGQMTVSSVANLSLKAGFRSLE